MYITGTPTGTSSTPVGNLFEMQVILYLLVILFYSCDGFVQLSTESLTSIKRTNRYCTKGSSISSRRGFTAVVIIKTLLPFGLSLPILRPQNGNAVESEESQMVIESDMTNGVIGAQFRTVTVNFRGEYFQVFVDGSPTMNPDTTPVLLQASYEIPMKWSESYLDTFSNGSSAKKACERIIVYQTPVSDDSSILEKATSIGVAKALGLLSKEGIVELGLLPTSVNRADIISARKQLREIGENSNNYYDFDVAIAPDQCSSDSDENLGLGFCPYEAIILISATIVQKTLVACCVLCTKEEWKRNSSDIKRVRSKFRVTEL